MGDDPVVPFDGGDGEPLWVNLTIFTSIPDFSLPCPSAINGFPHRSVEGRVVTTRLEQVRFLSHSFLGRIAGVFGKCLVDPQDHPVGIGDHHSFLRLEGDGCDAKIGFRLLLFSNILIDTEHAYRFVTRIMKGYFGGS